MQSNYFSHSLLLFFGYSLGPGQRLYFDRLGIHSVLHCDVRRLGALCAALNLKPININLAQSLPRHLSTVDICSAGRGLFTRHRPNSATLRLSSAGPHQALSHNRLCPTTCSVPQHALSHNMLLSPTACTVPQHAALYVIRGRFSLVSVSYWPVT